MGERWWNIFEIVKALRQQMEMLVPIIATYTCMTLDIGLKLLSLIFLFILKQTNNLCSVIRKESNSKSTSF